jgi:hypothetical protein
MTTEFIEFFPKRTNGQKNKPADTKRTFTLLESRTRMDKIADTRNPIKTGTFFIADTPRTFPGTRFAPARTFFPNPLGLGKCPACRNGRQRVCCLSPPARRVPGCRLRHYPVGNGTQRRNRSAPLLSVRLREKGNGASAVTPTAHQWCNRAAELLRNRSQNQV